MENKKYTKRAVVLSIIAVLMCCTLLIGGTFAWFTDSVVSGYNTIESGNLDVVLEYKTDWESDWEPVTRDTKLFKEGALYEPGYTEVVFLRVANAGNLALKYELCLNVVAETGSINVAGEPFMLSDYLNMGYYVQDEYSSGFNYADILMPVMFGDRATAVASVEYMAPLSNVDIAQSNPILPGEDTAQVVAMVLTMPETVGNEANHLTGEAAPTITLGINLNATQYTHEEDSFDNQYDKNATYPTFVMNEMELNEALLKNEAIIFGADITLTEAVTVDEDAIIYMNGYDFDASALPSGAAFTVADGVNLVLSADENSTITYNSRLVSIPEGTDATVSINGGNYEGNGNLINGASGATGLVTLNNVNFEGGTGAVTYFAGSGVQVIVNGGTFSADYGFIVGENSRISGAEINVDGGSKVYGVYGGNNTLINDTTINCTGYAVAVGGNDTFTIDGCDINSGNYAVYVYNTGGTVHINDTTYTGKIPNGSESGLKPGAVIEIYKDGELIFRKAK